MFCKNNISVMGVLNITPDSFFDGGQYTSIEKAIVQASAMQAAGAAIIDIGGESTRPGAPQVTVKEELERVLPVIKGIRAESNISISIDTSKPEVMFEAINAGANMINDVRALTEADALSTAVKLNVPVCLMHMQGNPDSMQKKPQYQGVVEDVLGYLDSRIKVSLAAGLQKEQIIIDPGFGFGKTVQHNLSLLKHLPEFISMGYPVLVGMSRKSMLGEILNVSVVDRLSGSLALATVAAMNGASIIRTHDVKETVHTVKVCSAVMSAE